MNYYAKHIGDYYKKAGRLSMLQHGAYNQLMDACYDRETFPTREDAIDWTWASTAEEIEAVDFVLHKFFKLEGDIYTQKRISSEVALYQHRRVVNSINGQNGGRPKGSKGKKKKTGSPVNESESVDKLTQSVKLGSESKAKKSEVKPNQEPLTSSAIDPEAELCPELGAQDNLPADEIIISIPTNRFNSIEQEYPVTDKHVAEWAGLYPAVDIEQELRNIRGWNISNPSKRKTMKGMARHINSWLQDKQNKGGNHATQSGRTIQHSNSQDGELLGSHDTEW